MKNGLTKDNIVHVENNDGRVNVVLYESGDTMELHNKIVRLSTDLAWAEEQLKTKDMIIDILLSKLKKKQ